MRDVTISSESGNDMFVIYLNYKYISKPGFPSKEA